MATNRFNQNIIVAAQRLKSPRTDATASGDTVSQRYKSSILARYQNRAIRDIILEKIGQLGGHFVEEMPWYMERGTMISSNGSFIKPTDAVRVLEVFDGTNIYQYVSQDLLKVSGGIDRVYQGGFVFFEEGNTVQFLPVGSPKMIFRYVRQHIDIVPSNAGLGTGGKVLTGVAGYIASTRILTATVAPQFDLGDIGRVVVFSNGVTVFTGRVDMFVDPTRVVLRGNGLPIGDIPAVLQALVVESSVDANDILLPDLYDGQIQDKMVALGFADAMAGTQ